MPWFYIHLPHPNPEWSHRYTGCGSPRWLIANLKVADPADPAQQDTADCDYCLEAREDYAAGRPLRYDYTPGSPSQQPRDRQQMESNRAAGDCPAKA